MLQRDSRGRRKQVAIAGITALLACLWNLGATAADYYRPPEYSVPPGTTIIHAGTLLAVPGNAPADRQSIIVEKGKVVEVRDGFAQAADIDSAGEVRVVDLSDRFVMPGFIDLHVHLSGQAGGNRKADAVANLHRPSVSGSQRASVVTSG